MVIVHIQINIPSKLALCLLRLVLCFLLCVFFRFIENVSTVHVCDMKKSTVFFSIQIESIQFLTVFFCSQYLQRSTASFLVKSPYLLLCSPAYRTVNYWYVYCSSAQKNARENEWMKERNCIRMEKRNDMARLCSEFW